MTSLWLARPHLSGSGHPKLADANAAAGLSGELADANRTGPEMAAAASSAAASAVPLVTGLGLADTAAAMALMVDMVIPFGCGLRHALALGA
jgi:hypothetical protein